MLDKFSLAVIEQSFVALPHFRAELKTSGFCADAHNGEPNQRAIKFLFQSYEEIRPDGRSDKGIAFAGGGLTDASRKQIMVNAVLKGDEFGVGAAKYSVGHGCNRFSPLTKSRKD